LGGRKGIRPVKIMGDVGGGHRLVRMEWRPAGLSVCLPLLIFPCSMKFGSSLLAPAHPGGPRKMAIKRLWFCGYISRYLIFVFSVLARIFGWEERLRNDLFVSSGL